MIKLFSILASGLVCASSPSNAQLTVGSSLPEVSYVDQDGKTASLSNFKEKDWLLVYFYPKADTPGCTKQACSLRDAYTELSSKGVKIIGVSQDSPAKQKLFAQKYNLPFTLVADEDRAVIQAFGVPAIPLVGLAQRQAFLFKQGTLVWRDQKASTEKQAKDVLEYIKSRETM